MTTAEEIPSPARDNDDPSRPVTVTATLRVNGTDHTLDLDTRSTLVDVLRDRLGVTGPKKACDRGECGACTVHADGRAVLSCLTLAVKAPGRDIRTVEGLDDPVLRQAFIDHDAFQCGYCTPGQLMSAAACISGGHAGTEDEIREFMSGNICRCSAYPQIVAAIADAASQAPKDR